MPFGVDSDDWGSYENCSIAELKECLEVISTVLYKKEQKALAVDRIELMSEREARWLKSNPTGRLKLCFKKGRPLPHNTRVNYFYIINIGKYVVDTIEKEKIRCKDCNNFVEQYIKVLELKIGKMRANNYVQHKRVCNTCFVKKYK